VHKGGRKTSIIIIIITSIIISIIIFINIIIINIYCSSKTNTENVGKNE